MKEGQEEIYYVTGDSIGSNRKLLEQMRKKELEVLYMAGPIDEYCVTQLKEIEGKTLAPVSTLDPVYALDPWAGQLSRGGIAETVASSCESKESQCSEIVPESALFADGRGTPRQDLRISASKAAASGG